MTMARLRALVENRAGTAAAELALVLPLILALILATMEAGNYMYVEHKVAKGVRDGARYAGRLAFSNYDCATNTINATAATQIKQITRTGFPDGDNPAFSGTDNPVLGGWNTGDVTVSLNCATGQGGLYGAVSGDAPRVRVNASVAYPSLFQIAGLNASSIRIRAAAESAVMGI